MTKFRIAPQENRIMRRATPLARLATRLFDLRSALADFEFGIAFANDVDSATSFDHLAIRVAILQSADTADDLHRDSRLVSDGNRGANAPTAFRIGRIANFLASATPKRSLTQHLVKGVDEFIKRVEAK